MAFRLTPLTKDGNMDSYRYTATISFDGQQLEQSESNDLNHLTVFIVNYIETHAPSSLGEIIDNQQGRVIQRCKKSYID